MQSFSLEALSFILWALIFSNRFENLPKTFWTLALAERTLLSKCPSTPARGFHQTSGPGSLIPKIPAPNPSHTINPDRLSHCLFYEDKDKDKDKDKDRDKDKDKDK